jgi:PAS domain S-box-containing protein
MKNEETIQDELKELHIIAKKALQDKPLNLSEIPLEDANRLLHELQVHQIELEMQNEELRHVQQELEESRNRYSDLYDFAPVGYFTIDKNGIICEANLTGANLLGIERGFLIGKPLSPFIVSEDRDSFYFHRKQVFETKERQICEIRIVKKYGTQFYAQLESMIIQNSEGNFSQCRTIISDVTERKQAEEAQRNSEERRRLFMESATDLFFLWDQELNLVEINQVALKHYPPGTKKEDLIGKSITEIIPNTKETGRYDKYIEVIKTGENILENDVTPYDKFGDVYFDLKAFKVGNELGMICNDITERKEIDRVKSDFFSTISHELRYPLAAIFNALTVVADGTVGAIPKPAARMIDIVRKNNKRLMRLVDDILDVSKIEAGKMEFNLKPMKIMSIIKQAIEENISYADNYGVKFILNDDLPNARVNVDQDRMMQVMANLLSNAAKFSLRDGTVAISVCRLDDIIRVSVCDHGSGIPQEFRDRVFQKFAQANNPDIRSKGGTGLGLNISKKLVEGMNGQIGFETEIGVGTTFYFDLPEYHIARNNR